MTQIDEPNLDKLEKHFLEEHPDPDMHKCQFTSDAEAELNAYTDKSYETGYAEGENSVNADWVSMLSEEFDIETDGPQSAVKALNAYILGEVMELVGEDENKKVVDWDCPCGTQHHLESDYYQRNQLRQELRNKANKKWGK